MTWSSKAKTRLLIAVCSATSAAVAGAVGYVTATKLAEKKFEERLDIEIEKAKELYQNMYSTPTFDKKEAPEEELLEQVRISSREHDGPPRDLVGEALDAVHNYQPSDEDEDGRPRFEIQNIFEAEQTAPGEEVLAALLAERNPDDGPYLITKGEFLENEPEMEQEQFTYYQGDDILVWDKEEDSPVDNDTVAGDDNLMRFGYGSGDVNVVYIRNESMQMDLHITRSSGKYAVEVMALDDDEPHLQHSQPRKFRIYDE